MNTNQYIGLIILAFWAFGPGALAQDRRNVAADPEMTAKAEASDPEMAAKAEASTQEPYNPLAPAKAAFYSGVLPGLGQ